MFLIIGGNPGDGKTSLMYHFLNTSHFDKRRYKNMVGNLNELIDLYNIRIVKIPNTHIFSNIDMNFFKFGYSRGKNNYINPFTIGFKNKYVKVTPVPPYSLIGIDEGQRYFNSRMSSYYPSWQSRFYEMHRHFDLDIIIVCQRPDLIDINIRALSSFIEIEKLTIKKNKYGKIKKVIWNIRFFENFKDYEKYSTSNGKEKTYRCKKIVADYNVFNGYNTQGERPRFIETYLDKDVSFKEYVNDLSDINCLRDYLNDYNSELPDNFYIREKGK